MRLINDIVDLPDKRPPKSPAQWTAIVPAAGRGTRLNFEGPKVLYPVGGQSILVWLTGLVSPLCQDMVFVLSPEGQRQAGPALKAVLPGRARTVIQESPTGMADAIRLCETAVRTPYAMVIWGDQVAVRRRTLAACMNVLESSPAVHTVIPTIERDHPYIHFVRDVREQIVDVYEAREADSTMARGENDCGVFLFRSETLFQVLREARGNPKYRGRKTGEENFLSLIPLFHKEPDNLITVRIQDASETVGINTPEDAQQVERILKTRTP